MENFAYVSATELIFGKDEENKIGALIKPYAKRILLHYGGQSIKRSGLYDRVIRSLEKSKIEVFELGGVVPNPRLSLVRQGIELCRKNAIGFILAVGGGSVIDSAKAISAGVHFEGDVWNDLFMADESITSALPIATILTIPAAGSECSNSAVVTNEETGYKRSYASRLLRPLFSIINPELFFTLPKHQIANGISDMMSHIFERYFTRTKHTELIDGLCESALKTIMKYAPRVMSGQNNYDDWYEIGLAGTVAHNGWLGLGRIGDWASHIMEHELSAKYDVAHGAGLAVMTPSWMRYVYKTDVDLFLQFAVNVMGISGSIRDVDRTINDAIDKLEAFYRSIGLPVTMRELGADSKDFEFMAARATNNDEYAIGRFKKLSTKDIVCIYKLADR